MWNTDERNIQITKIITTVLMAGTIGLAIFGAPAAMAESSKYGSCKEAAQDGRGVSWASVVCCAASAAPTRRRRR